MMIVVDNYENKTDNLFDAEIWLISLRRLHNYILWAYFSLVSGVDDSLIRDTLACDPSKSNINTSNSFSLPIIFMVRSYFYFFMQGLLV